VTVRFTSLLASVFAALLLAAAPALASLSDEVSAGQTIAGQLQNGTATCKTLSSSDFEHLGEYVMQHMVGSSSVHAAMNARMDQIMGSQNTDRMHQLLGRNYAGCATGSSTAPTGSGMMGGTGGGMMGGGSTGGVMAWGAMMSSSAWSWMHDGSWQHMSRGDWQQLSTTMMGANSGSGTGGGWSAWAVLAAVFGALLLGAVIAVAVVRRPRRPHVPGPSPS
jgi:hypothetical protein